MSGRTRKQFFFYYIFFFLCLVVLFVPLYQINLSMVSKNYLNTAEKLLEMGLATLENDLSSLEAAARAIYSNPKFRRLSYIQGEPEIADYYHAIPMVNDFKNFFAASAMIADCGIVYGNNMILTTKRIYFPGEQFYGYYFTQAGIPTLEQWMAGMPRSSFTSAFMPLSGFITLEGSYEAITFCTNFAGAPEKRAFFFATLKKDYILSHLTTDDVLKTGRILIRDPEGKLLVVSGAGEGKDAITLERTGRKRGIRVQVDIPQGVFREQLAPFQRMAFFFVLAYLALGIILSVFFAQRSAKPIREIVEDMLSFGDRGIRIPGQSGNPAENMVDFQNDYTYIRHFLSKAARDLETFNARLAQQEELQRENLFERLLYGLIYSVSDWQMVKDFFPNIPPVFRIAAVALPDMEEAALSVYTMRHAVIQDIIEPHLPFGGEPRASRPEEGPGAYVHFSGNLLVLLLPEEDTETMLRRLRALTADLRLKLNARRCRTSLSNAEQELRNIHRAFYLARHLLRLPPREGDEEILQKGNSALLSFPLELLDASRLYELLLHGEEEKAVDFINNMFYELCSRGYTGEDGIQQIFFIYRRVLLQIVRDFELHLPEETIPAYDSRPELSFLFARVAEAARQICGLINSRRSKKDNEFEQSVITYIDENITNPGLYTKMVTGFFHISENRLQAIARKWTGKSFLEYVESKRMSLSRELLLTSSKTIAQITRECGYSSGNSFYKAFRRFYGQSPSELRY
jgi:AraC-like DNA-binding protein